MTCSRILPLTLLSIALPALAHSQVVVQSAQGQVTLQVVRSNTLASSTVSIDAVVDRVMSFDLNLDRKVAMGELPERMHALFARGDADGDAALDSREVRWLAQSSPLRVQFGGYAFADEVGQSSSSRIEGAIDDLRLDAARRAQALAMATAFLDAREAEARTTLLDDMKAVLVPARYAQFTASLDLALSRGRRSDLPPRVPFELRRVVGEYALSGEQRRDAYAALERYEDQSWLEYDELSALAERMAGILSGQEREDLLAALERRPVVQAGSGGLADILSKGVLVEGATTKTAAAALVR